ncbi:MAG: serine/threonine-protein kinase [Myxococcota bacterium]
MTTSVRLEPIDGAGTLDDSDLIDQPLPERKSESDLPPRVGRFIVLGSLGRGGMGTVLRAYDETLDRQVALKLMHASRRRRRAQRVRREAQALAQLSHPNVVHVYEIGELDGQLFIAMELVKGETLKEWQRQRHPWRACLDVYRQAGRGLAAAHAAGLVHRDFKPSNCIIDPQGRVRVLDFGLARRKEDGDEDSQHEDDEPPLKLVDATGDVVASTSMLGAKLTRTGALLGTPAYMAPEQVHRQGVDHRLDQFSFCVSLYEALFGQPPFTRHPMPLLLRMAQGEEVAPTPPPSGVTVPRWLWQVIERGLRARPEQRFASMDDLLRELERHRGRTWARWALGGLATLSLTLAVTRPWSSVESAQAPCRDEDRRVREVWGDEPRAQVSEAILSTELDYAPHTRARVVEQLDDYAQQLGQAYVGACEATMVRHESTADELDARRHCLDQRTQSLSLHVALLSQPDPHYVEKGVELLSTLPRVGRCQTVGPLAPSDATPRTPQDEYALKELRTTLDQARALAVVGKYADGLRLVARAASIADVLGHEGLRAEVLHIRGQLLMEAGQHEDARVQLKAAYEDAVEHGADEIAIAALASLIYTVGVEQAQTRSALWLGSTAEALVARHRPDPTLEAKIHTAIGQVLTVRGDYPAAQEHFQRALRLTEQTRGAGSIAMVEPLDGLAVALRQQGEHEQADQRHRDIIEILTTQLGEQHPGLLAHQKINLGAALDLQGQDEQARAEYEEALEILEGTSTPDRRKIAHVRTNLGTVLGQLGAAADATDRQQHEQLARATAELEQAVALWRDRNGPDHPWLAKAHINLGQVLRDRGRHSESLEQYRQALRILRHNDSTLSSDILQMIILRQMGNMLWKIGRHREAEGRYREAIEWAAERPDLRIETSRVHNRWGDLCHEQSRLEDAEHQFRQSLALLEAMPDHEPRRLARTLYRLGRTLVAAKREFDAHTVLKRALAIYDRIDARPDHEAQAEQLWAQISQADHR